MTAQVNSEKAVIFLSNRNFFPPNSPKPSISDDTDHKRRSGQAFGNKWSSQNGSQHGFRKKVGFALAICFSFWIKSQEA